eukprot:m.63728 g.63728  ORF g.63728 m.63728 type:complete len:704 (+) comp23331_c0_seq2:120-2231(+)
MRDRTKTWSVVVLGVVWLSLAQTVCGVGDDAAANKMATEAAQMVEKDQQSLKTFQTATALMSSAVAKATDTNFKIRFKAAVLYMKRRDFKKASIFYMDAIKIADNDSKNKDAQKTAAMAHNNMCVELDRAGQLEPAFEHCQLAVKKAKWKFWYPLETLGLISDKWGETDAAREYYQKAYAINKRHALVMHSATMLPLVYSSLEDFDERNKQIHDAVDSLPNMKIDNLLTLKTVPHFYSAFFGTNNVQMYKQIAAAIQKSDPLKSAPFVKRNTHEFSGYVASHVVEIQQKRKSDPTFVSLKKGQKIKVGFTSMFFKEHASGKMIQGIIEGLDRAKFEVVIFCIKENFGAKYTGAVANRIRQRADSYIELNKPHGLAHLRKTIEDEKLDILVFAEIGMDPANYALAFARLAPVQVVTHGHASTTGIPSLDYFVSYKPFELRVKAQEFYSEKLVTFSDFSPYYKAEVPTEIPSRTKLCSDLKIPLKQDTILFVCLQTLFKLTPEFDPVFRDMLQRVPTGFLIMKTFRSSKVQEKMMERLKRTMPDVIDRVIMLGGLSQPNWFGMLRHGDVVIDSYPFGGYTTTLESLAAGNTPILTLPHEQMAGRCTKGLLDIMGISDTIAANKTNYVDIAVRLVNDKQFRFGVEEQMRTNSHLVFERQGSLGEWEQFLEEAANNIPITNLHVNKPHWRRIRSKLKPTKRHYIEKE